MRRWPEWTEKKFWCFVTENVPQKPAADLYQYVDNLMTMNTAVRVRGGESILSVTIVDQLSGATGFARAKLVAR